MAEQDVIGIEIETATTRGQQRLGMIELIDRTEMTPLIEHVPLSEAVLLVALDQRDRPVPGPGLGLQALGTGKQPPVMGRARFLTTAGARAAPQLIGEAGSLALLQPQHAQTQTPLARLLQ